MGEHTVIRIKYPWHKTEAVYHSGTRWYRWRPGIRWEEGYSDKDAVADGVGAMLIVEVGRYTPPGYRERVFYTRQFVKPSGEVVGCPKLKVIGAGGFTRLCRGWRYGYELVDALADVRMEEDYVPDASDFADAASY